jgi:CHAD domain-containing protein
VKARRISLDGLSTPQSAMQRIISVRFAEVLAQADGLKGDRAADLHALRISCKRLRYSIELFQNELPNLKAAAARLAQLQDELGVVHDCDVLSELAQERGATHLGHRLTRDRERHALRAHGLWIDAFKEGGPLSELIAYTGFGVPTP